MPRLPSNHSIVAQALLQGEMEEDDFDKLQAGINYVIKMVKDQLNSFIENEVDLATIDLDKLLLESLPEIYCDNETVTVKGMLTEYQFQAIGTTQ